MSDNLEIPAFLRTTTAGEPVNREIRRNYPPSSNFGVSVAIG
jgi:hypothetical protein